MKSFLLSFFLVFSFFVKGQNLYVKTYGNEKNKPIIFIHGGPSGNATLFEGTTAQKLADQGFYVIAYDRRGEGRSADPNAKFTFEEAFQDLNSLYKKYNLKKAIILGHSFGGLVATLYTNKYPQNVSALVLAGALFSQQETYDHILNTLKKKYSNNSEQLKKIGIAENLNKNSAEYRKGCYDLAGENDFFKMPNPTAESKKLYADYESGEFYKTNIRNKNAPLVFYQNEKQNNIDTRPVLKKIKTAGVPIYGIYGKDDGIFSSAQINSLKAITGEKHFAFLDNCSHYLFVDQQAAFIFKLKNWLK
ncbi:alpha/beta fold hydrolase [Flavobacterium nitrogenifigens]|uniref:Proline iminopeptidase n=1 Tax=Flavobacterium nitrogenifigens TaxID=1617283 RepID=A0A521D4I3_9FLAO|nr:alpha/beta hydrolase [Flavobacterium nitrogenifigens]KAF2332649.1 alpha/beta hydrolase [Flavobacterium nitrogenifigens]SMO66532.1 proline iminopeptidase [Flavobacterium nitrogenifigens]